MAFTSDDYDTAMNFALLGVDHDALTLASAIVGSPSQRLVTILGTDNELQQAASLDENIRREADWELVLDASDVDAVIVTRQADHEQQIQRLRILAQADIPLLVTYPTSDVLVSYELEMILQDTQGIILPYVPGLRHPGIVQMLACANEELGEIEQIFIQRTLTDRSRAIVLDQFARDLTLLRDLLGTVTRIGAMAREPDSNILDNLALQMSLSDGRVAHWTTRSSSPGAETAVSIHGSEGEIKLVMDGSPASWTLLDLREPGKPAVTFEDWNDPQSTIDAMVDAVKRVEVHPNWSDVCHDLAVVDAATDSLRRGKTIAIHDAPISEHTTFKGIMAAGGCGMLMVSLIVLMIVAMIEGLRLPFRTTAFWQLWPVYLLGLLAVFLVLQVLKFVFPRE